MREGHRNPRDNLLDYSIEKYGEHLVNDIRSLKRMLVLYLPLPIFCALWVQRGSRWTFQAKQMNGDLGFYTLKPDQIQVAEPLLILILIPIFETVIYPILTRLGIRQPLQKMVIGGIFMAISFVFAGLVQFRIEASPLSTVHVLWQLPQYLAMTIGDIMFDLMGNKNELILEFYSCSNPMLISSMCLMLFFSILLTVFGPNRNDFQL